MFQHMFTEMNELLDQLIEQYPDASESQKRQYEQQMNELKKVSDSFIEQWLEFEEKLSDFKDNHGELISKPIIGTGASESHSMPPAANEPLKAKQEISATSVCNKADLEIPDEAAVIISKGQGYYKLFMFPEAAAQFQIAIGQSPECNLARLFLAMTHMHMQNWSEAQRHFQLLIALTDFPKWLALGYNALGCIQAVHMNLAHAEKLFMKAHHVYPSFTDPLNNLKSCQQTPLQLSLYFGSTELCCL
ncbi:tetratricopeptide repeat protein [Paenibacillus harenae]|uniref:Tetratricopeptide (TPR) repeat protein n=1 Tax=Paenibacillus harenae TaxID=306543 RepID=A0ABT9TVV1_PAEHA|nr:hypothetical protein [Paenibacillus harenae]MDQ0058150.1 tetratricopeptide (TPR) repeat protein [Paenibacillus harenae]MDQ0111495.1 tetratricopeptide (TPR) repeat protein [Paenibacillus harenae]